MKLVAVLKHPLVSRHGPAGLRLGLYVGVIVGSTIVFVSTMGAVGTQLQAAVEASIGTQPKRPLPRSDVPNPKVISPPAVGPQGEAPAEVHSVFSSIAELTAPSTTTAVTLDPRVSGTITELEPPQAAGAMRIISDVTIRAMPENHGHPVGTIGAGAVITAVASEDGWVQIAQDGNVLGWIYQRFLEPAN